MELRVIPIDFVGEWPMVRPLDQKLHDLAVAYIDQNFVEPKPRLIDYKHVAAVCEMDGEEVVAVHGLAGYQFKPDFNLWRTSGEKAKRSFAKLYEYFRDHMMSNRWRGADVMVCADENAPESIKCPNLEESLKAVGAKPAHRYLVRVR